MSTWVEDPTAEVRRRADIVEIVSEVVVLKRSGRNYIGLCPFHGERTPSFNVNPERQIFRCFGCGEGGDVFTFTMKAHNQTFPEALRALAERYGVPLPDRRPDDDEKKHLRDANEQAANFYRRMLEHPEFGAKARSYLQDRGVSLEIAKAFGLGYAPPQWDGLHRYLLAQKVPASVQDKAALVRTRQSGGHYDYFRNRLIFPIHNEAGHIVGFGGRAIDAGDEPKYLNSPETPLYHKGNLLYGLPMARDAIKAKDSALLMEGYMDVITAHAHGFTHAVGVLGTALTPNQARTLLRYTPGKRVVIAFDADKAGQTAAERGISTLSEVAQGVGLQVNVLVVPEGKDPDAFLRREGASAFQALMDDAPDLIRYLLTRAVAAEATDTPEGRLRAVAAAVPILRKIENLVVRDHYVKWISQFLAVREESVRLEIGKTMRHNGTPSRGGQLLVKKLSTREAEQILLYLMVEQPYVRETVRDKLGAIAFEPIHQSIRERIEQLALSQGTLTWADLVDQFAGSDVQKTVSAIMFAEYGEWGTEAERLISDCVDTLEYDHLQRQIVECNRRMKDPENQSPEMSRALVEELKLLNERALALKHKRSNLLTTSKSSPQEI